MNSRQLALIKEFTTICTAASIEHWLRGGWAVDFFLGRVTREHDDVDLFVWAKDALRLTVELERSGFTEVGGPPPEVQRDFAKDGEDLQIALLERDQSNAVVVAGGPFAGAAWPHGILDGPRGRIGDLACPIINPRVQIEIKERFPQWRPDLPLSEKHRTDIVLLHKAMSKINR